MNFKQLVDMIRKKGVPRSDQPHTYTEVAEWCGVSRQHLYTIMNGAKYPRPHTIYRIAEGLGVSEAKVKKALGVTFEEIWES